jgi:hypothetical protein
MQAAQILMQAAVRAKTKLQIMSPNNPPYITKRAITHGAIGGLFCVLCSTANFPENTGPVCVDATTN